MTDKSQRDYAAEAKAALAQLRAYAADHAGDITGAIDKVADFVDKHPEESTAILRSWVHES